MPPKKRTSWHIRRMKGTRPIVMMTCYDATFARLVEMSDIDAVLVGDSLGNVIQGHATTIPVRLEDIIYHTRAVSRGLDRVHLVADMPFMSYQASVEQAMTNAGRLMQEGRAQAVKLEGGSRIAETIRRLTESGIPVMGHLGLTPQSFHVFGGYKVQGRGDDQAALLVEEAKVVEEAGAYSLVLESVPKDVAAAITEAVSIPTIGIGAGVGCDGQVLVLYDMLGLDERFNPTFLKKYESFADKTRAALDAYAHEVRTRTFPTDEHSHK